MKRSLLNIAMAAFISCFAACSEEEIIATQDGTPKEVTVIINRKTFCNAFPNHFVSLLHQLTQNKL